jgi:hypothetical protein
MKKLYTYTILFVAAALLAVFSSCRFSCIRGSGHQITETHTLGDFSRIQIKGSFKVNLKQDSSLKLSITADDNLMKYIHANIDGDKLTIYSKKNLCGSGEMVINIGVKQLESFESSGAINLSNSDTLKTKDISFDFNGASRVDLNLNAANVTTQGSGSVEVTLRGQASSHKIDLAGSGKIHAFDFVVGSYDIQTTGASHCEVNVLHDLNVNTTGAAEIQYKGNPSNVNSSKTGAASVTKVD